jgi:hypothetical protein
VDENGRAMRRLFARRAEPAVRVTDNRRAAIVSQLRGTAMAIVAVVVVCSIGS